MKVNFVTGQLASLNWAWCYGRVFQTASLFMIGMLLGRKGLFQMNADSHQRLFAFGNALSAMLCRQQFFFIT